MKRKRRFYFKKFPKCSSNRGMLLLEAILAIVILVVSISVIIESLVSGLRATMFTTDYSKAILLADNVMVEVMRQRSAKPSLPSDDDFSAPNEEYHYQLKMDKARSDESGEKLHEARLVVSWKSGSKEREIPFVTWVLDNSPDKKENNGTGQ